MSGAELNPEQVLAHFDYMGRTLYAEFVKQAEIDHPPPWEELSLRERTAWSKTHEAVADWYY